MTFTLSLVSLAYSFWPIEPLCGLHDLGSHHHGGGSAPLDPHVEAFLTSAFIIVLSAIGILVFCGPFLAIWTRRIRSLFWKIPGINIAAYVLSIALRPYPGGFVARFRPPGLWFTLGEILLLLLLSLLVALIVAIVTACARWLFRKTPEQKPAPVESAK